MESFLISNQLWGGAGSIADQAGIAVSRREGRELIEKSIGGTWPRAN
jgi:hypothetical protein